MIIYLRDPKNSTQKLLDSIISFSNVAGYKIKLQEPFCMPTMIKLRKNIGKQSHLQYLKKKIKYLGVNLRKDVNDLYKENCKPLKKEIQEDYRR
jgi:hypothetical protein